MWLITEQRTATAHRFDPASVCAGDVAASQNYCQLVVTLREPEDSLRNTEKQLEDLMTSPGKQVAFGASTGLDGSTGPFNTDIALIYKNVYSNTGSYNSYTKLTP